MSLFPALTGTASAYPLPNTAPTPAAAEPVRAEDVQEAVQALLNQDLALANVAPAFIKNVFQLCGDGGEGSTQIDVAATSYTAFANSGPYDFTFTVADIVAGQVLFITVHGHITLNDSGAGDRGFARLTITDPDSNVVTSTNWVVTTETTGDTAVPFSMTISYTAPTDGAYALGMQGKTRNGSGGSVGLAHVFSYNVSVFRP